MEGKVPKIIENSEGKLQSRPHSLVSTIRSQFPFQQVPEPPHQ